MTQFDKLTKFYRENGDREPTYEWLEENGFNPGYGTPRSTSLRHLRAAGFNPIYITTMICEETFVFKTDAEALRAHDEFEQNPKHGVTIQGWWYGLDGKYPWETTLKEYSESHKYTPTVYHLTVEGSK